MVNFVIYDLIFMAIFIVLTILFLYSRKKNLQKQGILFLYRTQFGVKFIDKFAKRYERVLKPGRYLVLLSGYILMISVVWLIGKTTYLYFTTAIADFVKAPPVLPLLPYVTEIKAFGLDSFFPPLYFTGPILGAFVEQDEKQMNKASKFSQLSVLAAGTFANVLMTILFGIVMILFFFSAFVPAGVIFNSYAVTPISVSEMQVVGNNSVNGFSEIESIRVNDDGSLAGNERERFFIEEKLIDYIDVEKGGAVLAIIDSPAFESGMKQGSAIVEIDGEKIESRDELVEILQGHSSGDVINVKTALLVPGKGTPTGTENFDIKLGDNAGKTFLGVGFAPTSPEGFLGFLYGKTFAKVKIPSVFYESKIGDFGWFIYFLLWWLVMINIAVALFNMLPLGILDGGRFFQLTIEGIFRNKKVGERAFKIVTWLIILVFVALMFKWAQSFF